MLNKKERLTKKEFDRFFSSGRRFHSPLFTLIHSQETSFHGAVVVGKKVFKRAVDRNRLRRRLYNILYRLSRESEQSGVYIILTKPQAGMVSFDELKKALESLVTQSLKTRT
ncbi:ribonuclease P protein component [Candidatus Kaiserbacteria bacterium RIFCSPHIGHO2_01_FULL_46_22]|uniref:Ribonuclease P protein component n=1 Tax=Candidatus Kaiserbacteria bacterium RIFCSPHIGHO2_01_FULL_46_22 TaxID=1798475 RepID=A0A1F6BXG3_9BACT|nr:MAG: ribonuclease P protein component [Candidatus Kaiserbacteria bacterium RIFCSPHIGHO2_01_FULL_46_22]